MIFKNISNFSCTSDYLPILNAALIVDLAVILRVIFKQIKGKSLISWYKKYGISSVLADVLSLVIGVIITRFIYPFFFKKYLLITFALLAVVVQLTHDVLFGLLINAIPKGSSDIMDTFKEYAKEFGTTILLADALMIFFTVIIASWLAGQSFNINLILFIISLYIVPYFLYSV